ncbi:30S ribosomal protein S19, partial [Dysosmobacter welbionis]
RNLHQPPVVIRQRRGPVDQPQHRRGQSLKPQLRQHPQLSAGSPGVLQPQPGRAIGGLHPLHVLRSGHPLSLLPCLDSFHRHAQQLRGL